LTNEREGPARQLAPPAYSPPMPSATTPTAPAQLRLEQPHHGRREVEHRRHQCHRHDQRLRDLPTHLLPSSGRASLRANSDDPSQAGPRLPGLLWCGREGFGLLPQHLTFEDYVRPLGRAVLAAVHELGRESGHDRSGHGVRYGYTPTRYHWSLPLCVWM